MPPPRRLSTPLTPVDYLKFNQMIARIRALEHVATEHFFRGNSYYRATIAEVIRLKTVQKKLPNPDSSFFNSDEPNYVAARADAAHDPARLPASALDSGNAGHGCTFPYCPSGGTCELCGLETIQNQLLAAAENP